jgi:hypothetical protein
LQCWFIKVFWGGVFGGVLYLGSSRGVDVMSDGKNKVKLFEEQQVRAEWDEEGEKWWFSVLDIVGILTDQPDYAKVRNYWKWLKNKLKDEGSELVSNTNQLKMRAADGKMRLTDVADTEQVLRLIWFKFCG